MELVPTGTGDGLQGACPSVCSVLIYYGGQILHCPCRENQSWHSSLRSRSPPTAISSHTGDIAAPECDSAVKVVICRSCGPGWGVEAWVWPFWAPFSEGLGCGLTFLHLHPLDVKKLQSWRSASGCGPRWTISLLPSFLPPGCVICILNGVVVGGSTSYIHTHTHSHTKERTIVASVM